MLSPGEIAQIKAEMKRLEKVRDECTDSGIRQRIEAWLKKEKLKSQIAKSDQEWSRARARWVAGLIPLRQPPYSGGLIRPR
jgi:hypothetical protein